MSIQAAFIMPHPPLIIPEVGRGQERKISATVTACKKIGHFFEELQPDTIIISSPHGHTLRQSFRILGRGREQQDESFLSGNFGRFGAPQIAYEAMADWNFIQSLEKALSNQNNVLPGKEQGNHKTLDHGTLIPIHFINMFYRDYRLVCVGISGLSLQAHYEFGKLLGKVSEESGKKVIFVASGDLSHTLLATGPYGFTEEGLLFERQIITILSSGNLSRLLDFNEDFLEKAGECGLRSFAIMAGALEGKQYKAELLSHESPFGVGYACGTFFPVQQKIDKAKDL